MLHGVISQRVRFFHHYRRRRWGGGRPRVHHPATRRHLTVGFVHTHLQPVTNIWNILIVSPQFTLHGRGEIAADQISRRPGWHALTLLLLCSCSLHETSEQLEHPFLIMDMKRQPFSAIIPRILYFTNLHENI